MRVDIVTAFRDAGATTIAADLDKYAPALYAADRYALVPAIEDDEYLPKLAELVRNIIQDGCEKASDLADETMRDVRDAMGLNYA